MPSDSNSSASTSPLVLTPESTGTPSASVSFSGSSTSPGEASSSSAAKKAKRQTAFYPNMNASNKPQNPFSRSAAKRESVMALGSIEHLQHFFTKTGLAARKKPLDKPHHGLVPAIGGVFHVPTSPSITSMDDIVMPPSPAVPSPPRPGPSPRRREVNAEELLPGVIEDLEAVAAAWRLPGAWSNADVAGTDPSPPNSKSHSTRPTSSDAQSESNNLDVPFDVLELLKITTKAIRSTRNYILSLPGETMETVRAQFRPMITNPSPVPVPLSNHPHISAPIVPTPTGSSLIPPGASAGSNSTTSSTTPPSPPSHQHQRRDPISLIRRAALDTLVVLRGLEETCRLPLTDDAYDAQSDSGANNANGPSAPNHRAGTPSNRTRSTPSPGPDDSIAGIDPYPHPGDASLAFSVVRVQGNQRDILVWDDEEPDWSDEDDQPKEEPWDERLVLSNGWLYKQDMKLKDVQAEREAVGVYLDVVDEVLFEGAQKGGTESEVVVVRQPEERGWQKEKRKREGRASSRAARRRVSTGDLKVGGGERRAPSVGLGADAPDRRRVTTGALGNSLSAMVMRGMSLSDEPDDMEANGDGGNVILEEDEEDEDGVDDEDLPPWARRDRFLGDQLGRAHAFLAHYLPENLRPHLAPASSRSDFLNSISSGQLLCFAYNACVRRSSKPWGFVNRDAVHDIIALEKASSSRDTAKMWTFRRTDNLRLWSGALKLRYLIPIQLATQPITHVTPNHTGGGGGGGSSSLAAAMTSANRLGPVTSGSGSGFSIQRPGSALSMHRLPPAISVARSTSSTPMHSPTKEGKMRFSFPSNPTPPPPPSAFGNGRASSSVSVPVGGGAGAPTTTVPASSASASGDEFVFDTRLVAKQEAGWEEMLEGLLLRWLDIVVEETRYPHRR